MKTQERYNSDIGSVTFRLKKADSTGLCSIFGTYLFKEYQIGFSTEIKIPQEQWDNISKKVISGKQKKEENDKLNRFRTIITKEHQNFNEQYNRLPSKEELKTIIAKAKSNDSITIVNRKKKTFDDVYQETLGLLNQKRENALNSGRKPLRKESISRLTLSYNNLKDFIKEKKYFLDLDSFDERMCLEFQGWLISTGLKPSTVKSRVQNISKILKRAFERGYTNNRSYLLSDFKVQVPPTIAVTLTEEEIKILYEYDFSNKPSLERVRDIFVLSCHTSLRYGDVTRLEPYHINTENKTIKILSQKVSEDARPVNLDFKFFGYTEYILLKYQYNIKNIAISNQKTNKYLKTLFKEIPYFKDKTIQLEVFNDKKMLFKHFPFTEKIVFHDSRRSFCTNRYIEGWDLLEIWSYTGHTNESTFYGYFKPTQQHEKIRRQNIVNRNERLQKVDLQSKQIEDLQNQLNELSKLVSEEKREELAKIISINKNVS
ncbi:tyrosine-type recombinase/integrase [Chryseobacterium sp.]|uniref:tyrosine-type recombinase/integrase n=1 Tax=Chryseobacterium sp. TaxID=1871047 RepID=UPI00289F2E0C|nr:phage integrase SAM-like domain-containing protein [Chryseobacterium sp.]